LNVDRDLRRGKTTANSLRQILGKFACHYFAVGRALLTRLLMLHNPPANFPICRRQQRVDDAGGFRPGCIQQREHTGQTLQCSTALDFSVIPIFWLSLGLLIGLFAAPCFSKDGNSLIGPFGLSPYLR
jgi:hypothetical protein